LSEYLERDMNEAELPALKQAIQDKCAWVTWLLVQLAKSNVVCRYVEARRARILEHCRQGYEKNLWHFET
jgi:hypothetical protein